MKNGEILIDRKSSTGPILMDLRKAFDKKKHNILIAMFMAEINLPWNFYLVKLNEQILKKKVKSNFNSWN